MWPNSATIDINTAGAKTDKGANYFRPHQVRIYKTNDKIPMTAGIFLRK